MSDSLSIQRLEELEAGRIFGDLSGEEWQEWERLSAESADALDGSLEWAAAQLEASLAGPKSAIEMPSDLAAKVKAGTADFVTETESDKGIVLPFEWWNSAPVAWAAAAAVTFLLVYSWAVRPGPEEKIVEAAPFDVRATDRVESPFAGLGDYASVGGTVEWSDELQEGYLNLENMPVNDPTMSQYQLWIVDPERDEAPVDGGVFDIMVDGSVRIPIDAKLPVDRPAAFLITLEKPGGVVKSKREVEVALATPS